MAIDSDECCEDIPLLTTARLRLDQPELADAGDIITLANNRKLAEMLSRMPHPYALEDARDWITRARNSGRNGITMAVRLQATGRLIGACGIDRREADGPLQLGYWIGEPHWGHGYATEAAHALIDHGFAAFAYSEIMGSCRLTNPASRRVLEKCGFQYSDRGMIRSKALGGAVPVENYRLDRKVWMALKDWASAS